MTNIANMARWASDYIADYSDQCFALLHYFTLVSGSETQVVC